jgi:hypothetical protein
MDFAMVDTDGANLPPADQLGVLRTQIEVVPLYNVVFAASSDDRLAIRVTNAGSVPIPALGPRLGTVVNGRPPTFLVAWVVQVSSAQQELARHALAADLAPSHSWSAAFDPGAVDLQPGDIVVVRLEVPDPTGIAEATVPGVFLVTIDSTSGRPDGDGPGAGLTDPSIGLTRLALDDPLATAAVAMIAPPPALQSTIASGAGVTP